MAKHNSYLDLISLAIFHKNSRSCYPIDQWDTTPDKSYEENNIIPGGRAGEMFLFTHSLIMSTYAV